jgi:hypothetical protein
VRITTSPKRMIFTTTSSGKRVLRGMGRLMHRSAWKVYSQKFALDYAWWHHEEKLCNTS